MKEIILDVIRERDEKLSILNTQYPNTIFYEIVEWKNSKFLITPFGDKCSIEVITLNNTTNRKEPTWFYIDPINKRRYWITRMYRYYYCNWIKYIFNN
jgi:hypothetical protein